MNKNIYIVEDDENIREMVKMALTSFSYEVTTFDNAQDALEMVQKSAPDMIIFDIMLPGISGLEATKQIRSNPQTKDLPVIMLTAKDAELDKVAGLDSGADDYIAKPFGAMELAARIRSVFRRSGHNSGDNNGDKGAKGVEGDAAFLDDITISDLSIKNSTREVLRNNKPLELTFKEYELLCMLINQRHRIVPREELLNAVWGFDFVGETRTLDIHIRTLRQKLEDSVDQPKYIKTVRNVGYRFIGE